MRNSLSKQIKKDCCIHAFKIRVYLISERQEQEYDMIINRFLKDDKFKMYHLCYWLEGRNIEYKISFKFVVRNGVKWNLIRYRNYLRLKLRLKE